MGQTLVDIYSFNGRKALKHLKMFEDWYLVEIVHFWHVTKYFPIHLSVLILLECSSGDVH